MALPEISLAIICGTGLSAIADCLTDTQEYSYSELGLLPATAPTHKGRLVVGRLGNIPLFPEQNANGVGGAVSGKVGVFCGRLHAYEGYSFYETAATVRKAAEFGAKTLVVTNAAGGINEDFAVGDIMVIDDHIKLVPQTPLLGADFIDMTNAYSQNLRKIVKGLDKRLKNGVYCYMAGPQFETPAEIRALRALGADAVGMSTVAEVIAARSLGLEVLGLSVITNLAAGLGAGLMAHEVERVAGNAAGRIASIVSELLL